METEIQVKRDKKTTKNCARKKTINLPRGSCAVFPSEAKQEAGESRDARVGASAEPAPGTVGARSSPRAA